MNVPKRAFDDALPCLQVELTTPTVKHDKQSEMVYCTKKNKMGINQP
jgi:hypothetical protein